MLEFVSIPQENRKLNTVVLLQLSYTSSSINVFYSLNLSILNHSSRLVELFLSCSIIRNKLTSVFTLDKTSFFNLQKFLSLSLEGLFVTVR